MAQDDPRTLVSSIGSEHLKDPDLRVIDEPWYLPGHMAAHIPGARFFDIDDIPDRL